MAMALNSNTPQTKLTYPQSWGAYTEAQTNELRLFDELLKDLVEDIEEPVQRMGRPRLSLKEQAFCAIQKVYSQLSSRRAYSLYRNAEWRDHINKAPNYNAVNKFLNREDITPILEDLVGITARPLRSVETEFATDASGFRTTSFGEYAQSKYDIKRRHKWLKAHICVGVKTNVITGVKVTTGHVHDSTQFESIVKMTAENGFNIKEVSADKGYSSRKNHEVVNSVGGVPYISFTSVAKGRSRGHRIWNKMYHHFKLHQDEFMEHYHVRSNVETTFHMIKMKFGDTLKSKNFVAQKNELLCKMIAHNIVVLIHEMYELGIEPIFSSN